MQLTVETIATTEPCPKRVMTCYVVSFCLCHQLTPPFAAGVLSYAAHVEVLLTPPAYATLRALSFGLRTGPYETTLTKHVHGGFGRCSTGHCDLSQVAHTSQLAKGCDVLRIPSPNKKQNKQRFKACHVQPIGSIRYVLFGARYVLFRDCWSLKENTQNEGGGGF